MTQKRRLGHFLLVLTIFVMSCDLSTFVTFEPPTPVPGAVDTIVAQTAAAASAQTAAVAALSVVPTFTASFTPIPSKTPSQTPSPTATFLFFLPSLTRTRTSTATAVPASAGYDCTFLSQSPSDGSVIAANANFQAKWTVRNTGDHGWDTNNVDFIYLSGAKLSKLKSADLPASVATGNKITLTVSMTAPNNANTYKTAWTLRAGKTQFCRLTMSIVVK